MNESQKKTANEIMNYYRKRANLNKYTTSPDFNLREVEINYLSKWLKDGIKILDVGCGNGYSTLTLASEFESSFIGIDFVPEMIESAKLFSEQFCLKGNIEFQVGDATSLEFPDETFDIVISQRCLLNLPGKDLQWQAIKEISRVTKPSGLYLMLEGTLQGLRSLNEMRRMFNLEPIPEAEEKYNWFSNKFDEDEMINISKKYFASLETIQRFGMYYFISRVIHPLLVAPDAPKYDARINSIAREICEKIPNMNDLGHVALFVFRAFSK